MTLLSEAPETKSPSISTCAVTISTALEAWESFKNLYSPKGFTSEFLICREFFNTTLDNLSLIEEYLNKVKQLSD